MYVHWPLVFYQDSKIVLLQGVCCPDAIPSLRKAVIPVGQERTSEEDPGLGPFRKMIMILVSPRPSLFAESEGQVVSEASPSQVQVVGYGMNQVTESGGA